MTCEEEQTTKDDINHFVGTSDSKEAQIEQSIDISSDEPKTCLDDTHEKSRRGS